MANTFSSTLRTDLDGSQVLDTKSVHMWPIVSPFSDTCGWYTGTSKWTCAACATRRNNAMSTPASHAQSWRETTAAMCRRACHVLRTRAPSPLRRARAHLPYLGRCHRIRRLELDYHGELAVGIRRRALRLLPRWVDRVLRLQQRRRNACNSKAVGCQVLCGCCRSCPRAHPHTHRACEADLPLQLLCGRVNREPAFTLALSLLLLQLAPLLRHATNTRRQERVSDSHIKPRMKARNRGTNAHICTARHQTHGCAPCDTLIYCMHGRRTAVRALLAWQRRGTAPEHTRHYSTTGCTHLRDSPHCRRALDKVQSVNQRTRNLGSRRHKTPMLGCSRGV